MRYAMRLAEPADLPPWNLGPWLWQPWRGMHRHPRTRAARRDWDRQLDRAKRSPRQLPTNYDDLMASDVRNRNWKRTRRTQWYVVTAP